VGFQIAELFATVGVHDRDLDVGLASAKSKMAGAVASMKATAAGLATAFAPLALAGGALAAVGALKEGVFAASDLEETQSKVNVVFGQSAAVVAQFGDSMAQAFGSNKKEMLDAAAGFGLVGKAAGMTQAQAAKLAVSFGQLADDASSFYNVPLEEALGTLKSALVGESEPIRRFGVLLNEDAVKAESLKLGLMGTSKVLTEQAKVMARASLIQKGLADATGDHARTAAGFANQWREMTGRLTELGTTVGSVVLPVFTQLLGVINATLSAVSGVGSAIANVIRQVGGAPINLFGPANAPATPPGTPKANAAARYGEKPAAPPAPPGPTGAAAAMEKAKKTIEGEKESKAADAALAELRKGEEAKRKAAERDRYDAALHKALWVDAYAAHLRSFKSFTDQYVKVGSKAFEEVRKTAEAVYENPKMREGFMQLTVSSRSTLDAIDKFKSILKEKLAGAFDLGAAIKTQGLAAAAAATNAIYQANKKQIDKVEAEKEGRPREGAGIYSGGREFAREIQMRLLSGQNEQKAIAKHTADAVLVLKDVLSTLQDTGRRGVRALLSP
jgi:hypothetical protein